MNKSGRILLGILGVVLAVLIVVLAVGGVYRARYYGNSMMGGYYGQAGNRAYMMRGYGQNMMYWNKGSQIFGVIKSIDGNKITITDNAGQSEVVVSQASTSIVSSTGAQIGLSALKAGQSIVVSGTTDQNNQIQAELISVQ